MKKSLSSSSFFLSVSYSSQIGTAILKKFSLLILIFPVDLSIASLIICSESGYFGASSFYDVAGFFKSWSITSSALIPVFILTYYASKLPYSSRSFLN